MALHNTDALCISRNCRDEILLLTLRTIKSWKMMPSRSELLLMPPPLLLLLPL